MVALQREIGLQAINLEFAEGLLEMPMMPHPPIIDGF